MTRQAWIIASLLIFLGTLTVYGNSPITSRGDTIWSLYVSASIVQEGNTNLDEYSSFIADGDYRVHGVNGHIFSIYPIGTSLLAAPFIVLMDRTAPLFHDPGIITYLSGHPPDEIIFRTETWIASVLVSFSAVLIFAIASRTARPKHALLIAITYAFGTSAWSTASRGLWQHGPSIFALSIALYLIVLSREGSRLAQYVGIPLVLAFIIRPTNFIPLLLLSTYVFFTSRQYFGRYLLWSLPLLFLFFHYSYSTYQTILPPYYVPGWWGENPAPAESLLGTLLSPSRGLFIFSPVLIFSIYGILLRLKTLRSASLEICLAAIIFIHWIVISHRLWYGGWSLGPRFFTDMLPYFAYFLIPVFERFAGSAASPGRSAYVFSVLLATSVFVHFRCATNWGPDQWNSIPNNVDENNYRLWDWSDVQFLRGLCREPRYAAPECWFDRIEQQDGTGSSNHASRFPALLSTKDIR